MLRFWLIQLRVGLLEGRRKHLIHMAAELNWRAGTYLSEAEELRQQIVRLEARSMLFHRGPQ